MLRVPLTATGSGRKLDMGGGDSKDKMMVGILVIVIVAAIGALIWSISTKKEAGRAGEDTIGRCVDPACDSRVPMTNSEWGELVKAIDDNNPQMLRGMNPVRVMCPECENPKYTLIKSMTCPQCGEMFVAPGQLYGAQRTLKFPATRPTSSRVICPECNVDVSDYWRKNKGKARK